ncbi:type II CRISPR RNA-guided endonuclease Cas9 [Bacteroidota bacterium]
MSTKRVLGLDLGAASIGWALIEEKSDAQENQTSIVDLGVRVIPYDGTEGQEFSKGSGESKNAKRTTARTIRKGYDRYQLRRSYLVQELKEKEIDLTDEVKSLSKEQLWKLRASAVNQQISLSELARLLLWLNQKRGYKSSRSDANKDKKDTEYVQTVKNNQAKIEEQGLTIGQYFWQQLEANPWFRVKDNIFPRASYIQEFDAILQNQMKYYPEVINQKWVDKIRNEIIYYQRPLKSQKGLVSVCEFAGFERKSKSGKKIWVGPKTTPRSSPLFQVSKIWETVNNLRIKLKSNDILELDVEKKVLLVDFLNSHEKMGIKDIAKLLKIKPEEIISDKVLERGIQGNLTKIEIEKLAKNSKVLERIMRFELVENFQEGEAFTYHLDTGELKFAEPKVEISPVIEKEPLFQVWHCIYSIDDLAECTQTLIKKFDLEPEIAEALAKLDFKKGGFASKSAKVIRKTLPYLQRGYSYSDAMQFAGYQHSDSLTSDMNTARVLKEKLELLPKNSLRQPVVEKILNQMINLVNAVIETYGRPDEIRVELARELKQSKDERNDTFKFQNKREREGETIRKELESHGIRATRKNVVKYRLYKEIDNEKAKQNAICVYCGQPISFTKAMLGEEVEVEHIIPRVKLFDDSQSNKTLAHRSCNSTKGEMTAYDFMKSKTQEEFEQYVERVNMLFKNGVIGKTKRDRLLTSESNIPKDFISRQLRETQYISRKSREILLEICRNVWFTSGGVTSELRKLWGWEDVLMNINLPKYRDAGLTQWVEWETDHGEQKHRKEVIKDWSKRDDQRHHAVDALTIACTKQGFIQRINTLNSSKTREEMKKALQGNKSFERKRLNLLQSYLQAQKPIETSEVEKALEAVNISYKSGKKVAVWGTRKVGKIGEKKLVQSGILVPRGPLSEESVYGKKKLLTKNLPLKFLFENPELIVKPRIRDLVLNRIAESDGDVKKAINSLKKNPVYLDPEKQIELRYGSCYLDEVVIKYKVDVNFNKVEKVIDDGVKRILKNRLSKFNDNPKEAFKDQLVNGQTLAWWQHEGLLKPIYSVRCTTGLDSVVPVKKDARGKEIGYVKPGNNHHIAIYKDAQGNLVEHVCSFWHAVERKKFGFPVIINNSNFIWDKIQDREDLPESFLELLPAPGLELEISLCQNEMIFLGLEDHEIAEVRQGLIKPENNSKLYRVQKISSMDYYFRSQFETQVNDDNDSKAIKRFVRVRSPKAIVQLRPLKVKVNCIGKIFSA